MKHKLCLLTAVAMAVLLSQLGMSAAHATLINGGFETGDLTGWTVTIPSGGTAKAVTSHTDDDGSIYSPVEGSYFAELKTDGPGSYTTLAQTLSMVPGDMLSGWAVFDAWDHMPWNDNAYVEILDSTGSVIATPWYSDVSIVGDEGETPWTYWSWTALSSDTYTLKLGVANYWDSLVDSYALFDATEYTPIPEPTTMLLLGFGLLGLAGYGIRRKKKSP